MATSTALAALPTLCATTVLPANAILQFGAGIEPITLAHEAIYQAPCPTIVPRAAPDVETAVDESSLTAADDEDHKFSDFRDPFYATQFPMCYALAATTVTAYMLVIMLFVRPRSFLDGGIVYLGRRGFTNTSSGGVSIGGRPWLQKVAALTVAISLTVATADTFRVAQEHYKWGIQNARLMQLEVMGSTELKVIRLVSDTFLWLAQAQTLIRLFPRQREKIIIKWAAFALITLDLIFSALNSFQYSEDGVSGPSPPNSFVHPVPALSYLFQLSLGILYAAWVIYYALMKKRYAFYHPLMKNICLVAMMGVTSVVIPVVFFILDISKPDFTGWGDYVRWVGAAAASVVVWEWVERIEALEREEKKDGILGREVFDGDDTLEINASEFPWFRQRKNRRGGLRGDGGNRGEGGPPAAPTSTAWPGILTNTGHHLGQDAREDNSQQQPRTTVGSILHPQLWPNRPAPIATPVSRTDTASAASTVYAVRYHPGSDATTRTPDPLAQASTIELSRQNSLPRSYHTNDDAASSNLGPGSMAQNGQVLMPARRRSTDLDPNSSASQTGWRTMTPARGNEESSVEVDRQSQQQHSFSPARTRTSGSRWAVRSRLEEFAANQAERIRERMRPTTDTENLPVMVIPAPARRGAALQQVLEEEELREGGEGPHRASNGSTSREMSVELARLDTSRSALSTTSHGGDGLPQDNPPLWPGVQPRLMYDDDDYSYVGDSMSEASSSVDQDQRGFEDGSAAPSGPSRRQ
ncbi:pH-response regulator protein palH/rim21 [Amphichorda felina]